jgi:hypothetical protein
MSERRRDVRARFGFTEADLMDPFCRSMADNLARTEARTALVRALFVVGDEERQRTTDVNPTPRTGRSRVRSGTDFYKLCRTGTISKASPIKRS